MQNVTGEQIRTVLLQVINSIPHDNQGSFQSRSVLSKAAGQLGIMGNNDLEIALLTFWNDLFRTGYVGWGFNVSNPDPPFCHLTEQGRRLLENLSRDPANPDGYISFLESIVEINPIAKSYISEALKTFNSNCHKSTAVMVGAATESIIIELRYAVVTKIEESGENPSNNLKSWVIKRIIVALTREFDDKKNRFPQSLKDSYEANWLPFTHLIRTTRNEAGHPIDIDPVYSETAHATLLVFPSFAKLAKDLKYWITSNY